MSTAGQALELPVPARRFSAVRRLSSFPVMISGLLSLLAVLTVRSRFDDPDMWWHLKMGQIIWTTHRIPTTDVFSYTTNHHSWIPQEWLSQTLIYGAYRCGGYSGLMLWLCVLAAAVLIAGYLLCWLYSGNAKVAFVGGLVIWLFATVGLAVRPQMVGYLLLIFELVLIHLGRTRSPGWFFCLPPLFALWVNCHGSFFLGLIILGTYLFCSIFNFDVGSLGALPWEPHRRKALAWAGILSAVALFVNPVGVKQILYPINTMFYQPINLGNVQEWMPLHLAGGRGIALLVVVGCVLLMSIAQRFKLSLDELMLLAMGSWLAISHDRMLFVFGILAAPVLCRALSDSWEGYDPTRDNPLMNGIFIAMSILIAYLGFPNGQYLSRQVRENSPVDAVQFIKAHHPDGNMLNEYGFGGYLIWAAPEYPVFIDGNADVFEWTGVLNDFGRWATLQDDPRLLLKKYNINFCLLGRTSPMAHVLPLLEGWAPVYSDSMSIVFARTKGMAAP